MKSTQQERFWGMSFGFLAKNGYYSSELGLAQIDRMAALNITWVALMTTVMQDRYSSTRMYRDFEYTPSDDELARVIERFHARGIRVMLKPIIECHDSAWRGMINFPENQQQIQGIVTDYWGEWFKSNTRMLLHYGKLAQRYGAEMMSVGCEMLGTQGQSARWSAAIAALREVYGGAVVYNADQPRPGEEYQEWYQHLDVMGFSFYDAAAAKPGASVEEMVAHLQPSVKRIRAIHEKIGRPIFFAECGCRSVEGGAVTTWQYQNAGKFDGQEQARYLEAVVRAFSPEPWWRGLFWWKWDEQQKRPQYGVDPAGDTGFTIDGKPAADAMKRVYAQYANH